MAIFAIILEEPNTDVRGRIQAQYPGHFEYSQTFFLIESDKLSENIAVEVGIKGDSRFEKSSGFVLKLERYTYSGYTTRSLWEWLGEVEKKQHG